MRMKMIQKYMSVGKRKGVCHGALNIFSIIYLRTESEQQNIFMTFVGKGQQFITRLHESY